MGRGQGWSGQDAERRIGFETKFPPHNISRRSRFGVRGPARAFGVERESQEDVYGKGFAGGAGLKISHSFTFMVFKAFMVN